MDKPFGSSDQTDIQSSERFCTRVTLPLDRSRDMLCRGARPAGLPRPAVLGFCPFSSIFGTCSPEITTHPKLIELVRIK